MLSMINVVQHCNRNMVTWSLNLMVNMPPAQQYNLNVFSELTAIALGNMVM